MRERTKPMVVICVSHGIPAHNGFLQHFEPDKDVIYLDYGALSIVERMPAETDAKPWEILQFGDAQYLGLGRAML